ncbi:MAG: type II secretion system F family protein [Bacillota bacterium]|nr:type II secretion system F family protein [Bacillota bacterium]MDW7677017.1 type II secretion system F family protein [Bacillota bacterium]
MNLNTLAVLTFITGFLLILGIQQLFVPRETSVAKRVKNISRGEDAQPLDKKPEKMDLPRKLLAVFGKSRAFNRMGRGMDKQLEESDIPLSGGEFTALVVASALMTILFFFSITMNPISAMAAGLAMGFIPFFLVKRARHKRLSNFNGQICDALSIMSNSLRAGFSFLQSMDMVKKEMPDPISKEFDRTFREVNLGASTDRALQNMAKRVNSDDLDLLITAVLIQRQIGGNLAEVLDKIAETIRERVRLQGEIRTLTAQGRLSGIVIGALPVVLALFMLIMNPTYLMELIHNPIGRMMLLAAVAGEAIGFMFINKIVKIQV